MLTIKENLMETMKGGTPDRFVNQFEFMDLVFESPIGEMGPEMGGEAKDNWGVTFRWPEDQLGPFPVHDDEHLVLKDITQWEKYVNAPSVIAPAEAWSLAVEHAKSVDQTQRFVTAPVSPGIFERLHHLMGMEGTMLALYEEPEAITDLINYITQFELDYAKEIIKYIKPDALYRHDDWGGMISTFVSPQMFEEFFLEPTKKIHDYYRANGVELIVHHTDSYAETLVPHMIEMGIDIWQGVTTTNNIPEMIRKYGNKMTYMGGLDSGVIDFPDWTKENIQKHVRQACTEYGKLNFIPNLTQGWDMSSFPGVYELVSEEIDKMSKELF